MAKKKKFPGPDFLEDQLQKALVQWLDTCVQPGELIFTHIPSGEKRDVKTGARLKAMGLRRGWPDMLFVLKDGTVAFCELKRKGASLDNAQKEFRSYLAQIGWRGGNEPPYLCARSVEEVAAWLEGLGAVLRIKSMI